MLGEGHGVAVAALAPALIDPALRLLVDDRGSFALLRREWAGDGTAEAVLVRAAGARIAPPAVPPAPARAGRRPGRGSPSRPCSTPRPAGAATGCGTPGAIRSCRFRCRRTPRR